MPRFAHFALTAALSLAAGALVTIPAAAQEADLVVRSGGTLAEWRHSVDRNLDRLLQISSRATSRGASEGIVQLRFSLDAEGRPTAIVTHHNSANPAAEQMARWAVQRLRGLDDAPIRGASGRRFQANILFADDLAQRDALAAQLEQMERRRAVAGGPAAEIVAVGF